MPDWKRDAAQWQGKSDEELAVLAAQYETVTTELITRYLRIVQIKAKQMANAVVDADDLMQEGLLGLLRAISTFDPSREIKFSTYADVCISNKMKTVMTRSSRTVLPLDSTTCDTQGMHEVETENPESIYLQKERLQELNLKMETLLSDREFEIFQLFLRGMRYEQMAESLQITEKSVDNAMQRVRRKLKSMWMN